MKQHTFKQKFANTIKPDIGDPQNPPLRPTQRNAFHGLKNARNVILNAPTGWGKSLVMAAITMYKFSQYPTLRCIIAVPETPIGAGFVRDWSLTLPDFTEPRDWLVQHNLCGDGLKKTDELIEFLTSKAMTGHVAVCTHATLRLAYKKLKKQRKLVAFRDLLLWVDEAHHVSNAQHTSGKVESNVLGELVTYCVKHKNHVGLATATWGRGDLRHILTEAMEAKFTRQSIPADVYIEEAAPFEEFSFTIVCDDFNAAVGRICADPCPTIIYIPKRNSGAATECKYTEVSKIIDTLAAALKAEVKRDDLLIQLVTEGRTYKVLDLVTEAGRDARKRYLCEATQRADLDIIISLDMCKEGLDWTFAERSIILGERRSLPEFLQIIGRLFRGADGKRAISVYQILPPVYDNAEAVKQNRNEVLSAALTALLVEDFLQPLPIDDTNSSGRARLSTAIPNLGDWQDIVNDFLGAASGKTFEESLPAAVCLSKYGIEGDAQQSTWQTLWRRFAYHNLPADQQLNFELLKDADVCRGVLEITTGLCGIKTLKQLRKVLGEPKPVRMSLEAMVALAETIADANGGKLPSLAKIREMGHGPLAHALSRYADAFAHIQREHGCWVHRKKRLVSLANSLVTDGVLPTRYEMKLAGHNELAHSLDSHPHWFAGIPGVAESDAFFGTFEEWYFHVLDEVLSRISASFGGWQFRSAGEAHEDCWAYFLGVLANTPARIVPSDEKKWCHVLYSGFLSRKKERRKARKAALALEGHWSADEVNALRVEYEQSRVIHNAHSFIIDVISLAKELPPGKSTIVDIARECAEMDRGENIDAREDVVMREKDKMPDGHTNQAVPGGVQRYAAA